MKTRRYFLVIFIVSLLLFLPLLTPDVEDQIYPFQEKFITLNVKTNTIQIETNVQVDINMSLSFYDADTDSLFNVLNRTIFRETTIDLPERGIYVFQFFSVLLADITIQQNGLPFLYPFIVILLGLINLGIFVYERYFSLYQFD